MSEIPCPESEMDEFQKNGSSGLLSGIKVVDLTRYEAAPVCTMILADMGKNLAS